MDSKRLELLKSRAYQLFVVGYTVSMFGNGMQFIANSWLAMTLSGKAYSVAIVMVAQAIPGVLLSPFLGVLVDRYDRKYIATLMDLFRAVMLLAVPVLWWMDLLQPWHLYLVTFLTAIGDTVYGPASMSLIREVVPSELLLYANSTNMISSQVGALGGVTVGGLLAAAFSPVYVMLINAATFLISAVTTYLMRSGLVLPAGGTGRASNARQYFAQMREGVQYIRGAKGIAIFYMLMLFNRSTYFTLNVLLAPFAKDTLNVGAAGFGYIDAMYAAGAIIGNFLLPPIARKRGSSIVITLGLGALSASVVLLAFSQNLWMAMAGYLFAGVAFQVGVLLMTGAQQRTELTFQGRVHSVFNVLFSVLSIAIYSVIGVLLDQLSTRWVYGFQALILAVGAVLAYLLILRKEAARPATVSA